MGWRTLLLLLAITWASMCAAYRDMTDWDSISPTLTEWSGALPLIPQVPMDTSSWSLDSDSLFQVVRSDLSSTLLCPNQSTIVNGTVVWPIGASAAGPKMNCSDGSCDVSLSSDDCKAGSDLNSQENLIRLIARHGNWYARISAQPAWAQLRYPIPMDAGQITFRFSMDTRYPPWLQGGNPCAAAAPDHECNLCTTHLRGYPWDFNVSAGVHILWSVPGADRHIITGPVDVRRLYDAGDFTVVVDSPDSLDLTNHGEVIVTLMTFNQYPYRGELVDGVSGYTSTNPTRCSIGWTQESNEPSGTNMALTITMAEAITRTSWNPVIFPSSLRPRLFGNNSQWLPQFVEPFQLMDCQSTAPMSPGWGEKLGFPDIKTIFDSSTLGYAPCHTTGHMRTAPSTISESRVVSTTYGSDSFRSYRPNQWNAALRVFHLVRRQKACLENSGAIPPCQFNRSETQWLISKIITSEIEWFDPNARVTTTTWGWERDSDGCCGFDLHTPGPLRHFSMLIDIMEDEFLAANATVLEAIKLKMKESIWDFVEKFESGHWALWNGNNWTPVLAEGAMYWAIAFWYEESVLARKVIHIISDINILHQDTITGDGAYKEGVCQYSYMSVRSTLAIASLYANSFGDSWPTLNATKIASLGQWHMDSFAMGYAIDFGDSHACRGTTIETLYALLATVISQPNQVEAASVVDLDPCIIRQWATQVYFLTDINLWTFSPALAVVNWTMLMMQCEELAGTGATPMGPVRSVVYEEGHYGMIRSPVLDSCDLDAAERFGCSNATTLPKLKDASLYSQLSIQARPNSWPHSEVDFGTFKWSAFGSDLVSEYGYGSIATSVNEYDARRLNGVDNSPSGHNTIVVHEATTAEADFSQFQYEEGTITEFRGAARACQHLDGSNVYGSTRQNGWLQYMHRWFCLIGNGHYILIEAFAVKPGRGRLSVYGSQYGGPSFEEGTAASYEHLTIHDYFYTSHFLGGTIIQPGTNTSFNRTAAHRWCSHTDIEFDEDDNSSMVLRSRCRFLDASQPGDIVGRIAGWSENGGSFAIDGLTTAENTWGSPVLHKNRFRFVADDATNTSGDIRIFLMTAAQESDDDHAKKTWISDLVGSASLGVAACVEHKLVQITIDKSASVPELVSVEETDFPCDPEIRGSGLDALATSTTSTSSSSSFSNPLTDSPTTLPTISSSTQHTITTATVSTSTSDQLGPSTVGTYTTQTSGQVGSSSSETSSSTTVIIAVAVSVVLILLVVIAVLLIARRKRYNSVSKTPAISNPVADESPPGLITIDLPM